MLCREVENCNCELHHRFIVPCYASLYGAGWFENLRASCDTAAVVSRPVVPTVGYTNFVTITIPWLIDGSVSRATTDTTGETLT